VGCSERNPQRRMLPALPDPPIGGEHDRDEWTRGTGESPLAQPKMTDPGTWNQPISINYYFHGTIGIEYKASEEIRLSNES